MVHILGPTRTVVGVTHLQSLLRGEAQRPDQCLLVVPHLVVVHANYRVVTPPPAVAVAGGGPFDGGGVAVVVVEGLHVETVVGLLGVPAVRPKKTSEQRVVGEGFVKTSTAAAKTPSGVAKQGLPTTCETNLAVRTLNCLPREFHDTRCSAIFVREIAHRDIVPGFSHV